MEPALTTRLGSYEVVRKLARGGMAEIFLARTRGPEGFEKLVVLKKILPKYVANPKFVRLFLDEGRLNATLDHPHIARVFDMGKEGDEYFLAMEYIHGEDMRSTLRRTARLGHKFPIDHAVQIARDMADALHYAHERQIVHRDVSPQNLVISYEAAVKLVDFGVAKASTNSHKTRTGTLKGKIAYMSPEQAKGAPIDRRSDIFSLGIVLWEMAATHRLYKAENDLATLQMIINSKASRPSQLNPSVPPELDRIILRALAIELDERYQTAEQMQLDLEALKLASSTTSLRAYMQELFAPEIDAWHHAQASGRTLIEHLTVNQPTELTRPISESDFIREGDFISDDDDEPSFDEEDLPDSEQATAMHIPLDPRLVEFPVAPPEWRRADTAIPAQRIKRILISASIAFAVFVLLVMLTR